MAVATSRRTRCAPTEPGVCPSPAHPCGGSASSSRVPLAAPGALLGQPFCLAALVAQHLADAQLLQVQLLRQLHQPLVVQPALAVVLQQARGGRPRSPPAGCAAAPRAPPPRPHGRSPCGAGARRGRGTRAAGRRRSRPPAGPPAGSRSPPARHAPRRAAPPPLPGRRRPHGRAAPRPGAGSAIPAWCPAAPASPGSRRRPGRRSGRAAGNPPAARARRPG